jgi:PPM family protein phosphatase
MAFFRRLFQKSDPEDDAVEPAAEQADVPAEETGALGEPPTPVEAGSASASAPETAEMVPVDSSRQTAPLEERTPPAPEHEPVEEAALEVAEAPAEGSAERPAEEPTVDQDDSGWQESTSTPTMPRVVLDLPAPAPAAQESEGELLADAGTDAPDTVAEPPDEVLAVEQAAPADHEVWAIDPAEREPEGFDEEEGTRPLTMADVPALAALRSRRSLAASALRDIGRVRSVNQDSVFALITTVPRETTDVSIGLFIVADGMGGHQGGEVASRLAVGTVARYVLAELIAPALADGTTEALQPLIIAAVQEANRTIWEHAQSVGSDMGTTCTVALLLGRALYVGHVGDSRAYLATPTGMRLISNDHSTVGRLIQLGQLDPSEAREHPLRSQLYRTVGQHPEVLVDFIYQPIGDATHLLLCSDGLWGMLDEEVLYDVLEHTVWPQDTCRELVARANLAGGDDNISAVVVTLPSQ